MFIPPLSETVIMKKTYKSNDFGAFLKPYKLIFS